MIRQLLALVVFAASLGSAWWLAGRLTRRLLQILAPVGLGLLVAYESVLFNLLSVFRAVTVLPVTVAHVIPPLLVLIAAARSGVSLRARFAFLARPPRALYMLFPLLVIVGFLAVYFPPSNWDSMTYHMARVAHWMQNGSVGYFGSGIPYPRAAAHVGFG